MQLTDGLHLAYCTNIHRGENWMETFAGLELHTRAVQARVSSGRPYAIGLRLSDRASRELIEPGTFRAFQEWLKHNNAYVFTINGFPYGQFHGQRVKEQVYAPDWSQPERLEYTRRLFRILADLLPPGVSGSVSTVPVSYKAFRRSPDDEQRALLQLWECVNFLDELSRQSGQPPDKTRAECMRAGSAIDVVDAVDAREFDQPGDLLFGKRGAATPRRAPSHTFGQELCIGHDRLTFTQISAVPPASVSPL